MAMLAVFCTNSINILAGVNGVEVGQCLVITASILFNDVLYVVPRFHWIVDTNSIQAPRARQHHWFSIYLLTPFMAVLLALWFHNRYPSRVFVGDTMCYFAGMLFAVVGILGHTSKTLILFFAPQVVNFVYSMPQLLRWVPCPRHRLPQFNQDDGLLHPSVFELAKVKRGGLMWFILEVFVRLRLVQLEIRLDTDVVPATEQVVDNKRLRRRTSSRKTETPAKVVDEVNLTNATHCSNLTVLNLILVWCGPLHERTLCWAVMIVQVISSLLAFGVRYGIVQYLYPDVKRSQ
jgi:UDP-N-acetylglucosamine--dolichyl-phosphate N-acetylglucosaminephosphotransferase